MKNKKKYKIYFVLFLILAIFPLVFSFYASTHNLSFKKKNSIDYKTEIKEEEKEDHEFIDLDPIVDEIKEEEVEEDHNSEIFITIPTVTEEVEKAMRELNDYLKQYKVSVMYENLKSGFQYQYDSSSVYYGASVIKMLDALYIYTKAYEGVLSLDDTVTYTSAFKIGASPVLRTKKIGEKVTLRELVKAAVEVSDNSAHYMLVSYIGKNKLIEFGKSLGAKYTLSGGDLFGSLTAQDGVIYAKALNSFLNNGSLLAIELKGYFLRSDLNLLVLEQEEVKAATKYGCYGGYFHNVGIVYDKNPYVIAILTKEGNKSNYEEIIKDVHKHVYELHKIYAQSQDESLCI